MLRRDLSLSPVQRRAKMGPSPLPTPFTAYIHPKLIAPPTPITKCSLEIATWATWNPAESMSAIAALCIAINNISGCRSR